MLIDLENEPEGIEKVLEQVSQSFRPGTHFMGGQMAPFTQPTSPFVRPRRLPPLTNAPNMAWKNIIEEPEAEEPEAPGQLCANQ